MSLSVLALLACFSTTTTEGSDPELDDEPPSGWIGGQDDSGSSGDGGSGDGGSGGGGSGDGGSGSGGDADGDGWAASSDCDDEDPDVNPGVDEDLCDGVDEDCDGLTDEDWIGDSYEENDSLDGGTTLGDLSGDELSLQAYLNPEDDVDYYYFYVEDGDWDWFDIGIDLTVPDGVDLAFELWWYPDDGSTWELMHVVDEGGLGRDETLDYDGSIGGDDSGWYGLAVFAAESSTCEEHYSVLISA